MRLTFLCRVDARKAVMQVVNSGPRNIAGWLLAEELSAATGEALTDALADAVERACQKLRRPLARLVTEMGYQALLRRALHLAARDFPLLNSVRAGGPDAPCLDGLPSSMGGVDPAIVRAAATAIIANLIALLATFIGEDIAFRVLRDSWPDVDLGA
jgi:hypothetical protein